MKILAFVNAHSMAHVTRPLELGKLLRVRGHELIFAGDGKYLQMARDEKFEVHSIPFISVEQMNKAVKENKLRELYPWKDVERFVRAETQLIEKISPDLILVDCRVTAFTSAELLGVPCVSIANAHMTNERLIPFFCWSEQYSWLPKWLGKFFDRVENQIELMAYDHLVLGDLTRFRKSVGLPRRFCYDQENGNITMVPDLPLINPMIDRSHSVAIGPIPWRNNIGALSYLDELKSTKQKIVYISIGSEGLTPLLAHLEGLGHLPYQFVIATGDPELSKKSAPSNVKLETFVNADLLMPHCDLVLCHGGNGTLYQALGHGLPVLGVAGHAEQEYCLKRLKKQKAALTFRLKDLIQTNSKGTPPTLRFDFNLLQRMIREMLENPIYREAAKKLQPLVKSATTAQKGADLIEDFYRSFGRPSQNGQSNKVWNKKFNRSNIEIPN